MKKYILISVFLVILLSFFYYMVFVSENNKTEGNEQSAILYGLAIEKGNKAILQLSNIINIEKQVKIELLPPEEKIWTDGKKVYSYALGAYKYEVTLKNVKPSQSLKDFETDFVGGGNLGPIYILKGGYSDNDSEIVIYLGIGQEKKNATIDFKENNLIIIIN